MSKPARSSLVDVPPVLLLGGMENSLSIVRSLGRRGIPVSVAAKEKCFASYSRFCHKSYIVPKGLDAKQFWQDLLLSSDTPGLSGSVIFACNDEAVDFVTGYESVLEKRYMLEGQNKVLRSSMLNKQKTLELARSLGIPIPNFWEINTLENIVEVQNQVMFPALIKPLYSHIFQSYFHKKFFLAKNQSELSAYAKKLLDLNIKFMISEMVPGPDSLLSSFYTYLTPDGKELFWYTKRVIRRFPVNHGGATYHITDWLPETAALGEKFFKGIQYKGLGNIEFKFDKRDGKLKLIEVNPRFTAAQELLVKSGLDISYIIYSYLIGAEVPVFSIPKKNIRLWYPIKDYKAYRELRTSGEISFFQWIKSVAHRHAFPYFIKDDPLPALVNFYRNELRR